jgi:hypothetical protein
MKARHGQQRGWTVDEVQGWFAGRVPDDWFRGPARVQADREEILVVGDLAVPDTGEEGSEEAIAAARAARIKGFREDTREVRMRIADEAEAMWARKVSWGARCGEREELFTTQSVPVMTRLRMPERSVLDTLIDAGVARSRSEALAWCVRLVGRHQAEWIDQLRDAMARVEQVRADGPEL